MTTKKRLAEQVQRIIKPSVTEDFKVDIREIEIAISQIRDNQIRQVFWDMYSVGENSVHGQFVTDHTLTATNYRITLPAMPITLPNNMGVFRVVVGDTELIPMPNSTYTTTGIDSFTLYEGKTYRVMGNEIEVPFEECQVDIGLIQASSDIDSMDFFPMPPDMEIDLIKSAAELFLINNNIPSDIVNNNISE